MDNYFSLETVADILSKSKFTIESWQRSGKLIPELDPSKYDKPYSLEQLLVFDGFKGLVNSKWELDEKIKPLKNYQLIELFAGAGGLALGLEIAGFKSILLNEKEKIACDTLKANRPNWNVVNDDIRNVDFSSYKGKVDLLTGGFPCQPFSYAGKKIRIK